MAAANLPNLSQMLGAKFQDEPLYAENVTKLTKQQALAVRACKKLEKECTDIEIEFFAKVHELEAQYQARFKELAEKRLAIVNGTTAVSEAEVSDVPLVYGIPEEALKQVVDELKDDVSSKGVPDFWLYALQNCPTIEEMIEEHDIPILKHLKNIEADLKTQPDMGFVLKFTFEPNEYFSNTVLEKTYHYKLEPSDAPPHLFDGPCIDTCKVTPVQWKEPSKNPCFKIVKRKQKKAKGGAGKFVTKQVAQASFFNFFAENIGPEAAETDYEIASLIREQVIPHAAVYYTGELHDDDDFDDEDSFGDYEDEDGGSDAENGN